MSRLQRPNTKKVELIQKDEDNGVYGAVGWFTSLWTLQEAVLCPDMEIYSRDWKRLAGPETLTTLMSFLEDAPYLCWDPEPRWDVSFAEPVEYEIKVEESADETREFKLRFPRGSASLVGLAHNSGISRVLQTLSPMSVFAELNFREYTDVCAPAIMSAIGVKDWKPRARSALPSRPDKMSVVDGTSVIGPGGLTGQGSLLPVNQPSMKFTRTKHFEDFHEERCDHPSVAGWVLKEDGSVYMRTAGIAACSSRIEADDESRDHGFDKSHQSDHMSTLSLQCLSHGVPPGVEEALGQTLEVKQAHIPVTSKGRPSLEYLKDIYFLSVVDEDFDGISGLATTLSKISGGSVLFAVVLCSDGDAEQGILLAQLEEQEKSGPTKLVKVGCYCIDNLPSGRSKLPDLEAVDWLVM